MNRVDIIENDNFEQLLSESWNKENNTEFDIRDMMRKCDVKEAKWAEEFASYRFAAFVSKSANFKNDKKAGRVRRFGVLFETKNPDKPISCCAAYINEESQTLYLDEGTINKCWKHIARNVRRAKMKLKREEELKAGEVVATSEEYIPVNIDLSALATEKRKPHIKKYQVKYEVIPPSKEIIALQSKKQHLLDDKKMRYYFESDGKTYHDRDCPVIKSMKPDHFMASADIPEGYSPCQVCGQKMLLRIACDPYMKQIPNVAWFLNQYKIGQKRLANYVREGMKFRSESQSELVVIGKEDSWIIKRLDGGNLQLWHNNYQRLSESERYISGGYHYQKVKGRSLVMMLDYIGRYTWERHLEGEAKKFASEHDEEVKNMAMETDSGAASINDVVEQKTVKDGNIIRSMLRKLKYWIMNLAKK